MRISNLDIPRFLRPVVAGAGIMIALSSAVSAVLQWDPGPHVGDLLAFAVEDRVYPLTPIILTHTVEGRPCTIEISRLRQQGGSFAVVSHLSDNNLFIAHWSGARTSSGDSDCGGNADLILTRADVESLAAAGRKP